MQGLQINEVKVRDPSIVQFGLIPHYGATTMTTQTGRTLTGVTRWKRKVMFTWNDLKTDDAQAILQALYTSRYPTLRYYDTYVGTYVSKEFYTEDEQALPVKLWRNGKYYYQTLVLTFTERGCSDDINSQ